MTRAGLYSGFEAYKIPTSEDIQSGLKNGILSLDTNVLLNLYRYNEQTADDLLKVAGAVEDRLFVPHQVLREFWRNRQSVIAKLGSASKDARAALAKNARSTKDAVSRWAKIVAIPDEEQRSLEDRIDQFYAELTEHIGEEPARVATHTPTGEDVLLQKLESLLNESVGPALSEEEWEAAVAEGERRVENSIPPGYMDVDKLEFDLPEGASGDYIIWHQLLIESREKRLDLILVTADTKDDWWNRSEHGSTIGPRLELIEEYYQATGRRFFLLEPADLIKHSTAVGVDTSTESLQDIERVRDEESEHVPWTADAARAVLRELDIQGHVQAAVIKEAIQNGGRISRKRVYELDQRDENQMLRGFTRPVKRVTAELQNKDIVPFGVVPLLDAGYETGVKTSHFAVPAEVVELIREDREGQAF